MALRAEAEAIYAAANEWYTRCLIEDGSVFVPGQLIWTAENVIDLQRAFTGNPLSGSDAFLAKFQQQLDEQRPEVIRLAAEMLWVLFLFPRKLLSPARKRELIAGVWKWSGHSIEGHPLLHDTILAGIGSAGTAFNTQRDRELEGLIDATLALKQAVVSTEADPWEVAAVIDGVPRAARRNIRNILLHLLYPAEFERIASIARKRDIVKAFAGLIGQDGLHPRSSAVEIDQLLLQIRRKLEEKSGGTPIDFYDADVRAVWDPPKPGSPTAPDGEENDARSDEVARRLDFIQGLEKRRGTYTGPPLNDYAWAGVALAHWLAMLARVPEPGPDLLLGSYLLLTADLKYMSHAANALVSELAQAPATRTSRRKAAQFLLAPYGLENVEPLPAVLSRFQPAPPVQSILAAAEGVRQQVAAAKESVSARHVLAALLLPSTDPWAGPTLEEHGVQPAALRKALLGYIAAEEVDDHEAWLRLMQVPEAGKAPETVSDYPIYAGFSTDALSTDSGHSVSREDDRLSVMRDVTALCEVLAAHQTRPPLAVGLFGDWGTGKSFFMELMRKEIEYLGKSNPSFYCPRVVQVWFNAWHYMDTNLWASLAARVFEALARQLEKWDDATDLRQNLFEKLQKSHGVLAEAVEQREDAQARIEAIRTARAEKGKSFAGTAAIAFKAAAAALSADPQVQQKLRDAGNQLGLSDAQAQVEQAGRQVRELRSLSGRLTAIGRALVREPRFLLLGTLIFGVLAGGTTWALARYDIATGAARAVAQLAAVLGSLTAALAPVNRRVTRAVRWLEEVSTHLNQRRDAEQRQEELAVEREIMRLDQRERDAQAQVDALTREIEELRAGRRLQRFIMERHTSAEYRQHLGIVNLIRNDFEQLSNLLSESAREQAEGSAATREGKEAGKPLPRIDRIVLYIDDLDRCPEDRVVEVLQAIHLLLAFPLFVVIVGVDSRWLLLSLEDHYTALRGRTGEPRDDGKKSEAEWSTTPQNYLEKIFQIPFTLRPMESTGFGSLVDTLLPLGDQHQAADGAKMSNQGDTATSVESGKGAGHASANEAVDEGGDDEEVEDEEDGGESTTLDLSPTPVAPNPRGLTVEDWERDFIRKLHPLVPSPRALKRFTNVYRFIRVQQRGTDLDRFRGTKEHPGEFQVAALLLAALVGHPREAARLLRRAVVEVDKPWWTLVEEMEGPGEKDAQANELGVPIRLAQQDEEHDQQSLRDALLEVKRTVPVATHPPETFARWARSVARFSFQSGRILSVRDHRDATAAPGSSTAS